MTDEGTNLSGFIQEILKLCKQISDMLGAADRLMGEEGWQPWQPLSDTAFFERSGNLYEHKKWFPSEVFRLYISENNPHILAFISVLLFDRYKEFYHFTEPIISAGWLDYGTGEQVDGNWRPWYARFHGNWRSWYGRFHGYMKDTKDDGTLCQLTPSVDWPKEQEKYDFKFKTASTFGFPLMSINTAEDLKSKITDQLLDYISKAE